MVIKKKNFQELTNEELYNILKLRSAVFVVEQGINYLDFDDLDQDAIHYFMTDENGVYAYLRIIAKGNYYQDADKISRLCVRADKRKNGVARFLMLAAINDLNPKKITISAQMYLHDFYLSLGFKDDSIPYIEEEILHIRMVIQ